MTPPRVDADTPSAPPLGGINLGVSKFSHYVEQEYQATECITSDANQADYMVTNGNPAASVTRSTSRVPGRILRQPIQS